MLENKSLLITGGTGSLGKENKAHSRGTSGNKKYVIF